MFAAIVKQRRGTIRFRDIANDNNLTSFVTSDMPPNTVPVGSPAKVVKMRDEVRCHIEDRPAYEDALEMRPA